MGTGGACAGTGGACAGTVGHPGDLAPTGHLAWAPDEALGGAGAARPLGGRGAPGARWRRTAQLAEAHPVVADALVAALVAAISAAWLVQRPRSGAWGWELDAALILPLVARRRFPVGVLAVISLVALAQFVIGTELVADLSLLVALYTVASQRPRTFAVPGALLVEAGAVMASFRWSLAGSWSRSLVFLSGLAAAAFLLGTNVRSRRARLVALTERNQQLERDAAQQAAIAAAAERARIAREMHDVIAHSLAVMITLADGAQAKLRSDPSLATAAIANVAEIGRQALDDTRRLLGVLRSGAPSGPDGAGRAAEGELAPQPGVAQVEQLLRQVRGTGIAATSTVTGQARPLPATLELTVFRIVQEAATNALKHAVRGTRVDVELDYGPDVLVVKVADDGRGAGLGAPGPGGHGLAGMRERAALYGGTVKAGPSTKGWVVEVRLPLHSAFLDQPVGLANSQLASGTAP